MNTRETFEEQPVASTAEHWTDRIARQNRQETLAFAKQYRLRVKYEDKRSREDLIIPGRRGHLYFDDGKLCLMMLDAPVRERSVLEAIGGKLWTSGKSPAEVHLYRGAPAVRCWSKYQETDKGISLCAATLRKDSGGRSTATEDPTKVSCPFCVQLMHPQACGQAAAPCSWCTGVIPRPKVGGDVQDVKITGIPLKNARLAIRLVGATPRKILSEAQRRVLADGAFKSKTARDKSPTQSVESSADPGVVVRGGEVSRNEERPV